MRRQQEAAAAAPTEIEVCVPEGLGPGAALAVEYLGQRFDCVVPEGCGPGAVRGTHRERDGRRPEIILRLTQGHPIFEKADVLSDRIRTPGSLPLLEL